MCMVLPKLIAFILLDSVQLCHIYQWHLMAFRAHERWNVPVCREFSIKENNCNDINYN